MNTTPRAVRLAAALASVAITYSLLSAVFALAQPPVASVAAGAGRDDRRRPLNPRSHPRRGDRRACRIIGRHG